MNNAANIKLGTTSHTMHLINVRLDRQLGPTPYDAGEMMSRAFRITAEESLLKLND